MSLLYPLGLLLGLVAPVVVALYLRRTRRVRVVVSSLHFWQRVADQQPRRRFLGALRNPLSLLLQLLALLLLLLALVRLEIGEPTTARQIVVIDGRARMQAHSGAVWEDAVREATRVIARGGDGTETAIILAGSVPRIVSPFSPDRSALRAALDDLAPSDGGGDLDEAVALANRLRAASETSDCTIVVITDRPREGDESSLAVGRGGDNLAITSFAARRPPASPQTTEIFTEVGNFSASARDVELTLSIDGKTFDLKSLRIEPGSRTGVSVFLDDEILRGTTARVEARLAGNDNLAIDDTAFLALVPEPPLRVLLVTEGNRFLEAALAADSRVALELLSPSDFSAPRGAGFDVVLFDGAAPAGSETVRAAAFIGGGPFVVGEPLDLVGDLVVTNPASPLLRGITLADAAVRRGAAVEFPPGARVDIAAEWSGRPALASLTMPDARRVVVVPIDLASSPMTLRASFPLLVSNTVHWLAGRSLDPRGARRAGEFLDLEVEATVTAPDGKAKESGSVVALDQVGFYNVTTPSETELIGVSTASAAESALAQAETSPLPSLARIVSPLPLWQWLAVAALTVILTEWILFHRRVTE